MKAPATTQNQTAETSTQTPQTPTWLVTLLLLFFPPAAWYFMWKEKRYHFWFPILLWLYGGLTLTVSSVYVFYVLPRILEVFKQLNTQIPSYTPVLSYLSIIYGLVQLIFGVFLWKRIKSASKMSKNLLIATLGVLIFNLLGAGLFQGMTVMSTITPIYNLTSQLEQDIESTLPQDILKSTVTPTETIDSSPNSTSSPSKDQPPIDQPKVTNSFLLATTENGDQFLLKWHAYELDESETSYDNELFKENISAPVNLVKISNQEEFLIKENIIQLLSGTGKGYFSIISHPTNSKKVLISQGIEGTGGIHERLINLNNGEVINSTEWMSNGHSCMSVPFQNDHQKQFIFRCKTFVTLDTYKEKLFIYDLITNSQQEITSLTSDQTFTCEPGYEHSFLYEYLPPQVLKLEICDKDKNVIKSITVDLE